MNKRKKIETLLRKALLQGGEMAYSLYEYELEEHIDYWYNSLKADRDEFVFAVTENTGHVAMVLITLEKTVYVNEEAREKLSQIWPKTYEINMNLLIPMMAADIAADIIAVNGVKTVEDVPPKRGRDKPPRRVWSGKQRINP